MLYCTGRTIDVSASSGTRSTLFEVPAQESWFILSTYKPSTTANCAIMFQPQWDSDSAMFVDPLSVNAEVHWFAHPIEVNGGDRIRIYNTGNAGDNARNFGILFEAASLPALAGLGIFPPKGFSTNPPPGTPVPY